MTRFPLDTHAVIHWQLGTAIPPALADDLPGLELLEQPAKTATAPCSPGHSRRHRPLRGHRRDAGPGPAQRLAPRRRPRQTRLRQRRRAIALRDTGDATEVTVEGIVQVGGTISKMMMDRFFACLQQAAGVIGHPPGPESAQRWQTMEP